MLNLLKGVFASFQKHDVAFVEENMLHFKPNIRLSFLVVLALLMTGCLPTLPASPTANVNSIVAQTLAAYTVEAALTQAVGATQPPPLPPATPTTLPTETPPPPSPLPTATSTPEEVAPNPLPMTHTGVILNVGECFDFDTGQVSLPDQRCDLWLDANINLHQINGALLSGYATREPPSRSRCAAARHDPGYDVSAVQTDLYMCVTSSEGRLGFMVARQYRGSVPFTGIVFDYWMFR